MDPKSLIHSSRRRCLEALPLNIKPQDPIDVPDVDDEEDDEEEDEEDMVEAAGAATDQAEEEERRWRQGLLSLDVEVGNDGGLCSERSALLEVEAKTDCGG